MKATLLLSFLFVLSFVKIGAQGERQEARPVRFAVIGDYGSGDENERSVANLVDSWDVDFVITTGDNYYLAARGFGGNGYNQYDNSVGKFYCAYLKDVALPNWGLADCPSRQQSQTRNRFFPTIGNHDRTDTQGPGLSTYLNYFTLPGDGFPSSSGSERYYDFVQGPVHFFALDSDTARLNVDDLAVQKSWLRQQLHASSSPWKIVYFHQPAFSSSNHGSDTVMQWPFAEWGADAVFQGHDHVYERILREGIVYFVSGNGGKDLYEFDTAVTGSVVRYDSGHGAVLVTATDETVDFEAWAVNDQRQNTLLTKPTLVDLYHLPPLQQECASIEKSISFSGDNAVEKNNFGRRALTAPNLALIEGDNGPQTVAFRFDGVDVPPHATIDKAAIEIAASEYETVEKELLISGQDAADAPSFTASRYDITSRPRTAARVEWPGMLGRLGALPPAMVQTPNLASVIQEIVDRPDWSSGNALAIFIDGMEQRTGFTLHHGAGNLPVLSIIYCRTPSIGGEVWVDANENGRHDPDEHLRASLQVDLWVPGANGKIGGGDDQLVNSTHSGNQGYGFYDVVPGSYFVVFDVPDRFALASIMETEDVGQDNDLEAGTRSTRVFTYSGDRPRTIDATVVPDPPQIEAPRPVSLLAVLVSNLFWVFLLILAFIMIALGVYFYRKRHMAGRSRP